MDPNEEERENGLKQQYEDKKPVVNEQTRNGSWVYFTVDDIENAVELIWAKIVARFACSL